MRKGSTTLNDRYCLYADLWPHVLIRILISIVVKLIDNSLNDGPFPFDYEENKEEKKTWYTSEKKKKGISGSKYIYIYIYIYI